jgi:hypothetical protein
MKIQGRSAVVEAPQGFPQAMSETKASCALEREKQGFSQAMRNRLHRAAVTIKAVA